MSTHAQALMSLFAGLERAHGTYQIHSHRADGKRVGKAYTLQQPVTVELWDKHLSGEYGLGIVPIRDDCSCLFGAIDIDTYNLNHAMFINKIDQLKLPVVPCRSKSGGCHLFLFVSEPVPATLMQQKLKEIASALGYGTSEIFPKQTQILSDRGDIGQWINMPYFNGIDGLRYGLKVGGEAMELNEFLETAINRRLHYHELQNLKVMHESRDLQQGPPCLEFLIDQGFPPGTRNNGLFNLGVYLRKHNPDTWESKLEEYNHKFMQPPLSSDEVQGVKKSLRKKDFFYTCQQPPINGHCNASICKTRAFGVGSSSSKSFPILGALTKFDSQPPIWFIDVEGGGRMELTTLDLQNPYRFQTKCIETMNIMPPIMNKNEWQALIQSLLENAIVVEAPMDASPAGQLWEHIERFCTSRVQGKEFADMLRGQVVFHEDHHCFRMNDLLRYLDRQNFKEFKVQKISSLLKERGAKHKFANIKGTGTNYWMVPAIKMQTHDFDVVHVDGDY